MSGPKSVMLRLAACELSATADRSTLIIIIGAKIERERLTFRSGSGAFHASSETLKIRTFSFAAPRTSKGFSESHPRFELGVDSRRFIPVNTALCGASPRPAGAASASPGRVDMSKDCPSRKSRIDCLGRRDSGGRFSDCPPFDGAAAPPGRPENLAGKLPHVRLRRLSEF